MNIKKFINRELNDAEETTVLVVIDKGVVVDVKTNDSNAKIYVIDKDLEDIEEFSWPDTQA